MLVIIPHGGYLEEILKYVCRSNVEYNFKMEQCTIRGTWLNNPGDIIRTLCSCEWLIDVCTSM